MNRVLLIVAISTVLAVPALAQDATAATPEASPFAPVVAELAKTLANLAQVLIYAIGSWLLLTLKQKTGIDLGNAAHERLRGLASTAAGYVEEKGAQAVKSGLEKMTAKEKLDMAVDRFRELAPEVHADEARKLIEGSLPFVGAGASTKPTA